MTLPVIFQYDATGANEHLLPTDQQVAGYDTGSGGIAWTQAQFDRHGLPYPAVHIDQDFRASDFLSDILDVETGAATEAEMASWLRAAREQYHLITRKGQRWPGIYCSENNVTSVVATLQNAGITGCPIWVANYSIGSTEAQRRVQTAVGAFPAIGYQYTDMELSGNADGSWMNLNWIRETNLATKAITVLPPGSWDTAVLTGTANGETWSASWDGTKWTEIPGAWPVVKTS